jgi:exocyst complex component 6
MNGASTQLDLENHIRQIVNFPDSSSTGNSEAVDAILGPIFKDVLGHDVSEEFMDRLEAFNVDKIRQIEKMCNANHQEFVDAVDKLLMARKGAVGLRAQSRLRGMTRF